MSDVKWIKIATDIFDNRKIKMLESMPNGDSIIVIWFKLLSLAGSVNDNGCVYFTKDIAYTPQMLATAFNRPQTTVDLALNTFTQFGMIDIVDDLIHVSNWEKYQNIDGMEKIREQNRIRQQKRREKLRLECKQSNDTVTECHVTDNVTDNVTSHENGKCHVTDNVTVTHGHALDIDIDKDIDKEKDININIDIDIDPKPKYDIVNQYTPAELKILLAKIRDSWNTLKPYGIQELFALDINFDVKTKNLIDRLNQCGVESFKKIIEQIKASDYLLGKANKNGPVQFGWVVESYENYYKVMTGTYLTWGKEDEKQTKANNWHTQESTYRDADFKELEEQLIDN